MRTRPHTHITHRTVWPRPPPPPALYDLPMASNYYWICSQARPVFGRQSQLNRPMIRTQRNWVGRFCRWSKSVCALAVETPRQQSKPLVHLCFVSCEHTNRLPRARIPSLLSYCVHSLCACPRAYVRAIMHCNPHVEVTSTDPAPISPPGRQVLFHMRVRACVRACLCVFRYPQKQTRAGTSKT